MIAPAKFCLTNGFSVKITKVDGQCLLCLDQHETLMMASVFQAALLHEPTRDALLSREDYADFHRQVMAGLAGASCSRFGAGGSISLSR